VDDEKEIRDAIEIYLRSIENINIINIFINNKPNIKYKTYICAIIV